jgi:hypothetical protein
VHVVWCETDHELEETTDSDADAWEKVYYSMWDGVQWTAPNDIVSPQQDIIRNAIAIATDDRIHLLFNHSPEFGLYHTAALADTAWSAASWQEPRLVNGRRSTYMSDIVASEGMLHIVYDDRGADAPECLGCADIYYRQSSDNGATWSVPTNLFPTTAGSARPQIEVDPTGVIYVVWDEGWDRLSGVGNPEYGIYTYSTDQGRNWSPPVQVRYPDSNNSQLAVGVDGQGGVMLVWRTTSREYPNIFYLWSTDWGASWEPPRTIPSIVASFWTDPFDVYDMATDSAGQIHLVAGGYVSGEQVGEEPVLRPHRLYHLAWDGQDWSSPTPIFEGEWYPEYPHITVERGNQLHATWFVRQSPVGAVVPHQIYYAHGQSRAPMTRVVPPTEAEPANEASPTLAAPATSVSGPGAVLPSPVGTIEDSQLPDGLYTEGDDVLRLLIALLPVGGLIAVIVILRRHRHRSM